MKTTKAKTIAAIKSTTPSSNVATKAAKKVAKKVARKTTAKKATKKAAGKKVVSIASDRNFIDRNLHIVKKVDTNPRRKDTIGYVSFSKIKTGMTVEQFVEKGGRLRDLHWDLDHKYVELKKKA